MYMMKSFKLIYDQEEPVPLETGRDVTSNTTYSDSDTISAEENLATNLDTSHSDSDTISAEENSTTNLETDKDLSSDTSDIISAGRNSDDDFSADEFECELCYGVFNSEYQLNLHMETHSEYVPSDGSGSDAEFDRPNKKYKKSGRNDKNNKKTKKVRPKREKCKKCDKYYASLDKHIEKVHLAVKCTKCDKIFDDGLKMKAHILRVHSNRARFPCEVCKKSYSTKSFLRIHKESKHEKRVFMCEECGGVFTSKENLNVHKRKHSEKNTSHRDMYQIVCDVCGKTVKSHNRWRHMRTHSKTKALKCAVCGRGFNEKEQLDKHSRTHTGEKPYKCKTCPKAFNHNVSLKAHMKKCH
ncbi:zinc finger protein 239-like [Saccostrea echinata]|uniref:zinc finger protein 239-like n=1 Tax=Saccostrea echinata TaxID=191078 RepID=UPI002A819392|nr:zinc finger protein 239-like [Saccostrea echinata]